uniref:Uncharacterized protein isoform X4 n=1 Tax=Nicotiana tabacum TaxID=4097 RepID=A0A1S4CTM5_TOBAC|nr:PREDICTED: uncharacterized protein LOC107822344 isoform X4 [Nicotiana tabacum]
MMEGFINANKDEACLATNNRNVKAKLSLSPLQEGISKLLSQWPGLQMAIQNEWGGQDSPQKSKQLSFDILSCLSQSNGTYPFPNTQFFTMIFSADSTNSNSCRNYWCRGCRESDLRKVAAVFQH